jgi:Fe-S cluster assembly protein SufD
MMSTTITTLPRLSDLTDAQIAEAARAAGEPAWLIERRVAAWKQFAVSEPPFWRRTDLSKLQAEAIAAPAAPAGTTLRWDERLASQGVLFTSMREALREHAELVQQYFGQAVDAAAHKFSALHAALWQDGVFLYVPKNVAAEVPFHAIISLGEGGNATFPHSIVILERGASASFIEEFTSGAAPAGGQAFSGPATELFVGEGASLRYVPVQAWGSGVYHIGSQRAVVGRDGTLEWVALNLGGQVQHLESETALQGDGSRVDWVAATLAGGSQSLLTAPWLRHIGANTEAHMDFKTVVKDTGYTTFDGMIKIEHESRGTISRLEEHALHLSPKARSDSIPGLMIDTNDVAQAGHASTSGQVEEEQLFYMQARGIPRDEALHMIVMGFFGPVIERIPSEELREHIAAMIESRI